MIIDFDAIGSTENEHFKGGEEPLMPGTCHYCPQGSSHAVQNPSDEDLAIFAVAPNHPSGNQ